LYPQICARVNNRIYDWKVSLAKPPDASRSIVHLDVDDPALQAVGQWPWDRSRSAAILERLTALGAKVVAFDVLYTTPGKSAEGDAAFFNVIKKSERAVFAFAMGITLNSDQKLEVEGDPTRADALYDHWSAPMEVPSTFELNRVHSLSNSRLPLTPIMEACAELGHIKGTPDSDGVNRRVPLVVQLEDRYVVGLSVAALKVFWKLGPDAISLSRDGHLEIKHGTDTVRVPVDKRSALLVNWCTTWGAVPSYSVMDVLDDKPDPARESRYKDKIVVVGVTATGTTDMGITPAGVQTPLSRVHSSLISSMLTKSFIREIQAFPYVVLISFLAAIAFALGAPRLRLKLGIIAAALYCLAGLTLSVGLFIGWRCELPIAEFMLIFIPTALVTLYGRAVIIERQAARASRALERYLSPELLAGIVSSGEELDLSTRRRELTVLFLDIQGFSTISETVEVEYVNAFLNDFFDLMSEAIFLHKGTIDKFLGDGLLAFFGDPVALPNHALSAVQASAAMQKQMDKLNARWSDSGIADFKKGVRIRIGINTGLIIVGNVGSTRRLEYTVVGSAVNIASRLQSLAPPGGMIMTARTKALVEKEVETAGPEFVRVKGIDREIEVYKIPPGFSILA
jgi:adenylate cyclase